MDFLPLKYYYSLVTGWSFAEPILQGNSRRIGSYNQQTSLKVKWLCFFVFFSSDIENITKVAYSLYEHLHACSNVWDQRSEGHWGTSSHICWFWRRSVRAEEIESLFLFLYPVTTPFSCCSRKLRSWVDSRIGITLPLMPTCSDPWTMSTSSREST